MHTHTHTHIYDAPVCTYIRNPHHCSQCQYSGNPLLVKSVCNLEIQLMALAMQEKIEYQIHIPS